MINRNKTQSVITIIIVCVMLLGTLTLIIPDNAKAVTVNFWVASKTTTSITVAWHPTYEALSTGLVCGYKLYIRTTDTLPNAVENNQETVAIWIQDPGPPIGPWEQIPQYSATFTGLTPSSNYYMWIYSFGANIQAGDIPPPVEEWKPIFWEHETYLHPLEGTTNAESSTPPPPPSGGGCPYIAPWGISGYAEDNNILPQSENFNRDSLDVEDNYILNQPLAIKDGYLPIKVMEYENEHSTFDRFKLTAIDHPVNTNLASSPDGEISAYPVGWPTPLDTPISATNSDDEDITQYLSEQDGNVYYGVRGDWAIIDFGQYDDYENLNLILRTNSSEPENRPYVGPNPNDDWWLKTSLDIKVIDIDNSWKNVAKITPRMDYSTQFVDMMDYLPDANGDYKINISWTQNHGLEFLAFYTGPTIPVLSTESRLLDATNQYNLNVTYKLNSNDEIYTDMFPNEEILLEFKPVEEQIGFMRDYMLTTTGHYVTLRSVGVFQEIEYSLSFNDDNVAEVNVSISKKVAADTYEIIANNKIVVGGPLAQSFSFDFHPEEMYYLEYDMDIFSKDTTISCTFSSLLGVEVIQVHSEQLNQRIPISNELGIISGIWAHNYSRMINTHQNVPIDFNIVNWQFKSYLPEYVVGIQWDFGDNAVSSEVQPTHTYLEPGMFVVTANITLNYRNVTYSIIEGMPINVLMAEPNPVINIYQNVEIALEIAGRKDNSVVIMIYENENLIQSMELVRTMGQPNTNAIELKKYIDNNYDIELVYEATHAGSNPIWLTFSSGENTQSYFREFSTKNGYCQTIQLTTYLDNIANYNPTYIFDGSYSSDIDGEIISYEWEYGDGFFGLGETALHTYSSAGIYLIMLTVTDDDGNTASISKTLIIEENTNVKS